MLGTNLFFYASYVLLICHTTKSWENLSLFRSVELLLHVVKICMVLQCFPHFIKWGPILNESNNLRKRRGSLHIIKLWNNVCNHVEQQSFLALPILGNATSILSKGIKESNGITMITFVTSLTSFITYSILVQHLQKRETKRRDNIWCFLI